jgi:hypothetical protein
MNIEIGMRKNKAAPSNSGYEIGFPEIKSPPLFTGDL